MPKTLFQAVTDRRDYRGKPFRRLSQSHDAVKPFTHVILAEYRFPDDRGVRWYAQSWAGSLALATKAAATLKTHISPTSYIQALEIVPVEIVK